MTLLPLSLTISNFHRTLTENCKWLKSSVRKNLSVKACDSYISVAWFCGTGGYENVHLKSRTSIQSPNETPCNFTPDPKHGKKWEFAQEKQELVMLLCKSLGFESRSICMKSSNFTTEGRHYDLWNFTPWGALRAAQDKQLESSNESNKTDKPL